MKVLFLTYPRIGLNRGGLQIQIKETARGLTELGVEVMFYDPWANQIPEADLCHVFSIDSAVLAHLERSALLRKPVVISPVFSAFRHGAFLTYVKMLLSSFMPGMYSDLKRAKRMMELASHIVVLNPQEETLVRNVFTSIPDRAMSIVPNGIDRRFENVDPNLFCDKYGVRDFVLAVGSIEPNKNQLALIRAVRDLNYPLVLIGRVNELYRDYFKLCEKEGTVGKVWFVGELLHDDPLLGSAFAAARLFVLPSFSEVMPLSLYEAALAGCKVIASESFPLQAEVSQYIPRFSPSSVASIAQLIQREMITKSNYQLKEIVKSMPSWSDCCYRILQIYQGVLDGGV